MPFNNIRGCPCSLTNKRLMIKKIMLALMAITGLMQGHALEYPYINFLRTDGVVKTMSVEGATFTFDNGKMVVTNSTGSKTFVLTEMEKMYFTQTSGLSELVTSDDQPVEVFNESGVCLGRYDHVSQALRDLDSGVYILKSSTTTLKIAVK